MQTIDQRILIPAPPDTVWTTISDIRRNSEWMADCEHVAFISQSRQGPGTRWRSTIRKGHDAIVQITAWYNGLGYEYTYIDGMPFKQNVGRIRLQELPEGTMVQWTFSFETKGVLTGGKRGVERTIEDSLKGLYKLLKESAPRKPLEAKSLMRDDPGVEARATYKPRHPSAEAKPEESAQPDFLREPPVVEDDNRWIPTTSASLISEPPIVEDDTRPRVAVVPLEQPATRAEPHAPHVPFEEPEFLHDLDRMPKPEDARFMPPPPAAPISIEEPPVAPDDTKPRFAQEVVEEKSSTADPVAAEVEIKSLDAAEPEIVVDPEPTPVSRAAVMNEEIQAAPVEAPPTPIPTVTPEPVPARTFTPIPMEVIRDTTLPEVDDDTASIWEVFKLPRPSETQEMRALGEKSAQRPALRAEVQPPRMGLRQFHRRRIVRLRRPSSS